jgi:pimeloyl-ACP methyl ester carboxylesterase
VKDFAATLLWRESSDPLGARVSRLARFRIPVAIFAALATASPLLMAADGAVSGHTSKPASFILVGFAGGFVRHDDPNHGPVQLAQKIRPDLPKDASIQIFENRHRKSAYRSILQLLDTNHDGVLSTAEKAQARIILFGHSWGASAVVMLSRELDRAGIPVLLTVQVDSVAKPWQRDKVIPDNVAEAANFYQPHGLVHGRAQITAANDSKTQIIGNYRFDYQGTPVQCVGGSWFQRTFTPSHMESQCDPHLWTQVEGLILQQMEPQSNILAVVPQP